MGWDELSSGQGWPLDVKVPLFTVASLRNQSGYVIHKADQKITESREEDDIMKLILKMLGVPMILFLSITIWVCIQLIRTSTYILGLAGTMIGLLGLVVLITYSVPNGIVLLVIAFLSSPIVLPVMAIRLLGLVQDAKDVLRDFVLG